MSCPKITILHGNTSSTKSAAILVRCQVVQNPTSFTTDSVYWLLCINYIWTTGMRVQLRIDAHFYFRFEILPSRKFRTRPYFGALVGHLRSFFKRFWTRFAWVGRRHQILLHIWPVQLRDIWWKDKDWVSPFSDSAARKRGRPYSRPY